MRGVAVSRCCYLLPCHASPHPRRPLFAPSASCLRLCLQATDRCQPIDLCSHDHSLAGGVPGAGVSQAKLAGSGRAVRSAGQCGALHCCCRPATIPAPPRRQVWAQPVFDTIESHLKARRIRKQSAAAGLPPAGGGIFADAEPSASAGGSMAKEHQEHQPSPFDVAAPKAEASGAGAHPPQPYVHWEPPLVVVAEASQSGEDMAAPSIDLEAHGSQALALALSYKGKLRSGQLSARGSGASLVLNTNPLPDLLPPGGERGRGEAAAVAVQAGAATVAGDAAPLRAGLKGGGARACQCCTLPSHLLSALPCPALPRPAPGWTSSRRLAHADLERRSSRLSSVGSRLGSQAMYHLDTGRCGGAGPPLLLLPRGAVRRACMAGKQLLVTRAHPGPSVSRCLPACPQAPPTSTSPPTTPDTCCPSGSASWSAPHTCLCALWWPASWCAGQGTAGSAALVAAAEASYACTSCTSAAAPMDQVRCGRLCGAFPNPSPPLIQPPIPLKPFFNSVVGLVGALTFWPITIYFPFAMYCKVGGSRWSWWVCVCVEWSTHVHAALGGVV